MDDDALLEEIESMIGSGKSDFWDALSSKAKNEIAEALKEIREGKYLDYKITMNEAKAKHL